MFIIICPLRIQKQLSQDKLNKTEVSYSIIIIFLLFYIKQDKYSITQKIDLLLIKL
jgi:hypothetical protein